MVNVRFARASPRKQKSGGMRRVNLRPNVFKVSVHNENRAFHYFFQEALGNLEVVVVALVTHEHRLFMHLVTKTAVDLSKMGCMRVRIGI